MAKALLGHLAPGAPRVTGKATAENQLLRRRVADLESVVLRLQAENDQLHEQLRHCVAVPGQAGEVLEPV